MTFNPACNSVDHLVSRRSMLMNMLSGAAGVGAISQLVHPAMAKEVEAKKKQVLIILLNGGLSQFESFDPKPNTDTGGPFRSIPTSVPGTHFCELMPHTAKIAHKLAVVRSMYAESVPGSHGGAREYAITGRPPQQGPNPWLGPACSTLLKHEGELPGNIHIAPSRWGPRQDSAFLGPRHASLVLSGGRAPLHSDRRNCLMKNLTTFVIDCEKSQTRVLAATSHRLHRSLQLFVRSSGSVDPTKRVVRCEQRATKRSRPLRHARLWPTSLASPASAGGGALLACRSRTTITTRTWKISIFIWNSWANLIGRFRH